MDESDHPSAQKLKRRRINENWDILQIPDFMYNVFSFLDGREINVVRGTCKTWYDVEQNEVFRGEHCRSLGILHNFPLIRETGTKSESGIVILGYLSGRYKILSLKDVDLGFMHYKNGLKDGEYFECVNGMRKVKHCWYKDGELHGPYEEFYPSGHLRKKLSYCNGKYDGEYCYYGDHAHLQDHYFFKKGVKHGEFQIYQKNTELLEATGKYEKGKMDGTYTEYWPKGSQIKIQCDYIRGKYDGKYVKYYKNGILEVNATMKNGNHVTKQEYFKDGNLFRQTPEQ